MKKQAIATTCEQAARLLQCGVSADTADMMCFEDGELSALPYTEYHEEFFHPNTTPAWSLSVLLGLLPKEIDDVIGDSFYFSLSKEGAWSKEYRAAYILCWYKDYAIVSKHDNDPIEACVQLIEWLTTNGYKLNEI